MLRMDEDHRSAPQASPSWHFESELDLHFYGGHLQFGASAVSVSRRDSSRVSLRPKCVWRDCKTPPDQGSHHQKTKSKEGTYAKAQFFSSLLAVLVMEHSSRSQPIL